MNSDEQQLRAELATLASSEPGRRLLQLGLRGIERGERDVTAGCWVKRGDAGCLFQHAYWQGVREGVFADKGRPGDWIGSFVGPHDYGIVVRAIAAFDRLARSTYADIEAACRAARPSKIETGEWNAAVEQLLRRDAPPATTNDSTTDQVPRDRLATEED